MKIIALGDTHGRSIWKEIVKKENDVDKIVFIGDYFDTHGGGYSANRQIENFKDIITFKKENMGKVVLLLGNHDFHYLNGVTENYSGYQYGYAKDINAVLQPAVDEGLIQMCFIHDKFVFSHAGLTKTWCQRVLGSDEARGELLQTAVNDMFKFQPLNFGFMMGDNFSQTGNDVTQGPIWVRPPSLVKDILTDITCVVGHTTVNELSVYEMYNIILIDCLGTSQEYLIIDNGEIKKDSIKLSE